MKESQSSENIQVHTKYLLDRLLAATLLFILSPLFLIIYVLIRLDSNGPGFYLQSRVGKDGKDFKIYKFRTMKANPDHNELKIEIDGARDPRITRLGGLLRKTSIDELPQLINILKGEMSFIGPRPTLRYQVEKYDAFQLQRLQMKPGITGWAQVNGRNSIPWPRRIEYDVWYVKNYSLLLDVKILVKTVGVIFKKDIVYGESDEISREDR